MYSVRWKRRWIVLSSPQLEIFICVVAVWVLNDFSHSESHKNSSYTDIFKNSLHIRWHSFNCALPCCHRNLLVPPVAAYRGWFSDHFNTRLALTFSSLHHWTVGPAASCTAVIRMRIKRRLIDPLCLHLKSAYAFSWSDQAHSSCRIATITCSVLQIEIDDCITRHSNVAVLHMCMLKYRFDGILDILVTNST